MGLTRSSHLKWCQPKPARLLHRRVVVHTGHATGAVKPSATVTKPRPAASPAIHPTWPQDEYPR